MSRLTFEALRPDDLLSLQFEARNLRLDTSDPQHPRLVVAKHGEPAYLIVRFPSQHIAEKAYFETAANLVADPPPATLPETADLLDPPGSVTRRLSGISRLVFRLPADLTEIPFNLASLLDWSRLELVVSKAALGVPRPPPLAEPGLFETALELPWRLIISPGNGVGWAHAADPAAHDGRVELWHTRLAKVHTVTSQGSTKHVLVEADDANTVPLRAIWSPDFHDHALLQGPGDTGPFLGALSPSDRAQLVVLTAGTVGYYVPGASGAASPWVPQPFHASRLFLSALGGWLTSHGSWPSPPSYESTEGTTQSLDLTEWRHVATQARDHYVRVVYDGFLYPFGHRASLVKVTERKVVPPDGGVVTSPTAYLKQHMYIVVREQEKTYVSEPYVHEGREMPFLAKVRIETHVTPDIDMPSYISETPGPSASFWVDVGGNGFPFHLTAVDLAGQRISFLAQLIFMSVREPRLEAVQTEYRATPDRRPCVVRGQKIAYADPTAGDTVLRTTALVFDTQNLQPEPPYTGAPFLPFLDRASVTVPALEQLLGTSGGVDVELYSGYLDNDLDQHAGVFAEVAGTPPAITFTADKGGGFATPNLNLTGLSARKGLVAGSPADAAAGNINPHDFFGSATIPGKIFGTVPLAKLIPLSNGVADASRNAPEIRTQLKPDAKHPTTVETKVHWEPDLKDYELDPVKVLFNRDGASSLSLTAKVVRSLTGGPPSSEIDGELTNFLIDLLGVIALHVTSIKFTSKSGSKSDVKAKLPTQNPITFEGPLAFVQTLAEILPSGIFGGTGLSIQLKPDRIRATYTIGVPPISIGVFAIEHISIMTGLDLPYVDGKPAFEFAFAKRSSPFLITVECLGGGGFVHLVVDADGVQMVEGALEFGGQFSLDLGVASGGVHVMAGIYFMLAGPKTDLTGFVDIGGEVSVLGIISVSIDLNLSLSYQVTNGKERVVGRAVLTVSVHIVFFSISVQLSVERSFGNSAGDPRVDEVISATNWSSYAAAFA